MGKPMTTKEILTKYYAVLSANGQFGSMLSENFFLTGTVMKETHGRDEFVNNLFFKFVKNLSVKTMIIDGERACAVVNYDLVSSKGGSLSCEVAEIWETKDGKLGSLAMYYDTVAFQKFILPVLFPSSRFKRKKPRYASQPG